MYFFTNVLVVFGILAQQKEGPLRYEVLIHNKTGHFLGFQALYSKESLHIYYDEK